MRNENLTREEARHRSALLHIDSYDVHVDLTHASDASMPSFPVRATVRFDADLEVGDETFIEYIHHSIDRVELNGVRLDLGEVLDGSRIRLPGLQPSNVLTVHGASWYSRSGEGMHRFIDPEDGRTYLYTQYEPADCRRVFPAFEQPDLKASFTFSVTAPKEWVVGSNTEVVRTLEDPTLEEVSRRTFAPTLRISTYITTLLAGQYHAVSSLYRPQDAELSPLPMTLYCRQSLAEHLPAEELFGLTSAGLDFFQDLFDYPYPFSTYDQAFVPEYNLGAMENPGLVTFTEDYLYPGGSTLAQREGRANVIMHEMSHMWFGDLVTMGWWSDLWLKESFAEFMGTLGAEQVGGYHEAWVTFAHQRKAWACAQDSYSTTHPVVADIPDVEAARQNFDGITYAKGASVLKQLVAFVGFEHFIGAARHYFRDHAFGTAELGDFLKALESACGRDLGSWAEAWLQSSGVTRLQADADGVLHQQFPPQVPESLGRPHRLRVAAFQRRGAELVEASSSEVEVPAGPQGAATAFPLAQEAALTLVNQEDLTYGIVLLPEDQAAAAVRSGHTLPRALDRAVLGGSLWNMVREGMLAPEAYLEHVRAVLGTESSATLLNTALVHAHDAVEHYLSPQDRTGPAQELAQALVQRWRSVEPGSDSQRIVARHGLRAARRSPELLDLAREVLQAFEAEGPGARLEGLEVGDEMAWSARIALAVQGQAPRDELDAALAARTNQHGRIGWAQATAALPSASAKQAAWEAVYGKELSNDVLTATAAGFASGPAGLRSPYSEAYFASLLEVWEQHSIGMATRIVSGLFPDLDACPDVVERAQQWERQHPDAPGALVREVVELREDAERWRRVRSR